MTEEDTFLMLRRWPFRDAASLLVSKNCPNDWDEFESITGWTGNAFNDEWERQKALNPSWYPK